MDETRALEASAGEYAIVAKRKGNTWYVGGITNNTERQFTLPLSFLGEGTYHMTAFKDGANASYQAMRYNKVEQDVTSTTVLPLHFARNGGWAAVFEVK